MVEKIATLEELGGYIYSHAPEGIQVHYEVSPQQELLLTVPSEHLVRVLGFLRDDGCCLFKVLIDIVGVDYLNREKRFEVLYHLLSLTYNRRIRVCVCVDESTLIPSIVDVYSAAGWFEREVWDMYGVLFDGNPDLRRILTDYGFDGHPQRKDFPLTGYVELRYDETLRRVVYQPVTLDQALGLLIS